jgi:hypothetical protein
MNVCAKIAHAHLSFGLLIPEFDVRENPDQDGLTMNRTVSHRIEALKPHIGKLRLDQINLSVIEKLRDTLRCAGLSPQTVNKVLTTATAIFKLAVRRNYWTNNPGGERGATTRDHRRTG